MSDPQQNQPTTKRAPLVPKIHVVTDTETKVEYLVRAKTNAGAIAAVSRRYTSRQATAEDVHRRRDLEVIEANESEDGGQ
jgi:hypothetical protein